MNLGEKLRAVRKNKYKLTLGEVSEKTNISVSFLSDIERDRTKPSLKTLEILAKFYKINISELVPDNDRQTNLSNEILPKGLEELIAEEPDIDQDIIEVMILMEHRAKKKPVSKDEWKSYYHSLKWMMGK